MKYEKMNARNARIYESFKQANAYQLYHVYGRYSDAKDKAFDYCVSKCNELSGYRFRIISHNSQIFTVGFLFEKDGKTFLAYITPAYDRAIEVPTDML